MHFEPQDQWTAADLLRHLGYERGRLVCETDYVGGADDEDDGDGLPGRSVHAHHNQSRRGREPVGGAGSREEGATSGSIRWGA